MQVHLKHVNMMFYVALYDLCVLPY